MDIFGDDFDNIIVGTGQDDLIRGVGGDDVLRGNNGDDELRGGLGDDQLNGGGGDDLLRGGSGTDILRGAGGEDQLQGQDGADRLYGGNRGDRLYGGNGDDMLYGQEGADTLIGGNGNDQLFAGLPFIFKAVVTQVDATTGNDSLETALDLTGLFGSSSNTDIQDVLNRQSTTVEAVASGAHHYYAIDIDEAYFYEFDIDYGYNSGGSVGTSLILLREIEGRGVFVDANSNSPPDPGSDNRLDANLFVEDLPSGQYFLRVAKTSGYYLPADSTYTLHVSTNDPAGGVNSPSAGDNLFGDAGDDILTGSIGADELFGGIGDDEIFAGNGIDYISAGGGNDRVEGGAGDDEVRGQDGDDLIKGGSGDDQLFGAAGADTIRGGSGNDLIYGGRDDDRLYGDDGDDILYALAGGLAGNSLHGGQGDDILYGAGNYDQLFGGEGDDQLFARFARWSVLDGGSGNNTLFSAPGRLVTEFVFDASQMSANRVVGLKSVDTISLYGFGYDDVSDAAADFMQHFDNVLFFGQSTTIEFLDADLADVLTALQVDDLDPDMGVVSADGTWMVQSMSHDLWIDAIA